MKIWQVFLYAISQMHTTVLYGLCHNTAYMYMVLLHLIEIAAKFSISWSESACILAAAMLAFEEMRTPYSNG